MKDFTLTIYKKLLDAYADSRYSTKTFSDFVHSPAKDLLTLRHDVDRRKYNALIFAKIQSQRGIEGTYYFRTVPESYDKKLIQEIASMGHEIGFHYETMDKANGDIDQAYELFCSELDSLRKIAPITSICMHGSPMSKYDNRDIWKKYDYRPLGIIAEPYFDIDFNRVYYLTDTGRRWNGKEVSVRDFVWIPNAEAYQVPVKTDKMNQHFSRLIFRSTDQIIEAVENKRLPNLIMMNFHPHRWSNEPIPWVRELVFQNIKNVIKKGLKITKRN